MRTAKKMGIKTVAVYSGKQPHASHGQARVRRSPRRAVLRDFGEERSLEQSIQGALPSRFFFFVRVNPMAI